MTTTRSHERYPTILNWDAWRNAYPALTYQQQQDFYSEVYAQHPVQRHYCEALVAKAIEQVQPTTVVELGGWDGELAHLMLDRHPTIRLWRNVELCREAAEAGHHRRNHRYYAEPISDWYWNMGPWQCGLFIASHTIEHLTVQHLNETVAATKARALFLDAPLEDKPLRWHGFTGTHILETGWNGVTDICNRHGYQLAWAEDHRTHPSSGDKARACLYLKESA